MKKWISVFSLLCLTFLAACASQPTKMQNPLHYTSKICRENLESLPQGLGTDGRLDRVSRLFDQSCYNEVIALGSWVRSEKRDKYYQVSAELADVLAPEGTFTEYIMESYERAYLSLLISMSYMGLHRESDALAELRRSQDEIQAFIYNYGEDRVLTLLQAALWDRFDPLTARPYWKYLSEEMAPDPVVKKFALKRLAEIDSAPRQKVSWRIFGLGKLPELDWQSQFFSNKVPYKISPQTDFPGTCSTDETLMISTSAWVDKIGARYSSSYHPLLFTKSLVRLPIAIGYGVAGSTAGVALGVGGCALGLGLHDSTGKICGYSIEAAGQIIGKSANFVEYTVSPDMRHWHEVPMAFLITKEDASQEKNQCLSQNKLLSQKTVYLIE